ncbi:MAG: MFS transporter [Chloroflexi bacterium]|nr:MAG: MFS transporter [Chloroflexota bacterium]
MTASAPKTTLSTFTKFIYGLGDWPTVAALTARSFFWLLFLTEVVGMPIGIAGTVVAVGRVWDAINDPLVGMLSDRLQSKLGRRRPFFLIGALPLGISFFLTFYAPNFETVTAYAIYYIVVFFIFDTSFTLINVPYSALTAELTQDYDERSSLAGWRMSMALSATLVTAAAFQQLAENVFTNWYPNAINPTAMGYATAAAIWGVIMVIVPLLLFAVIREPDNVPDEEPLNIAKTFREVFQNESFKWGAVIYLLTFTAVDIIAAIFVFFVLFAVGFEERSGTGSIVLGVVLLTAMMFMPVVVRLSRKYGKKRTYIGAMIGWVVTMLAISMVPSGTQLTPLLIMAAIAGIGYSAANAIPWAIVADVVEEDEWHTGKRREGIYAGYLVFFRKLAAGLAVAAVSWTLGWLGFDGDEKSPESIMALRIFIGAVPAILLAFSMWAASKYPLTKEKHTELVHQLAARKAAAN